MGFSLNPKYAPIKVSGTDIPNHMARIATSVRKGIAAEDPFTRRIRFIMKKSAKMIPGQKRAVSNTFVFHFSPLNVLYIRADT